MKSHIDGGITIDHCMYGKDLEINVEFIRVFNYHDLLFRDQIAEDQ